jgi:hypothetical protein
MCLIRVHHPDYHADDGNDGDDRLDDRVEAEFKASYVDYNISTCHLQDSSPFEESLDNENLIVSYSNGTNTTIRFGLIDESGAGGSPAEQYAKTDGLIYPIDDAGNLVMDATNTPTLAATRQWVLDRWKQAGADNLKMAELVNEFVKYGFAPVTGLDSIK